MNTIQAKDFRPYRQAVVIFRANPPHRGHYRVLNEALSKADHVVVLLGSSNVARSSRNPFTPDERIALFNCAGFGQTHASNLLSTDRVHFYHLNDFKYVDNMWEAEVHRLSQHDWERWTDQDYNPSKVGLCGYAKDHTSYYLKKFPGWRSINVPQPHLLESSSEMMSSTFLRNYLFGCNKEIGKDWLKSNKFMDDKALDYLYDSIIPSSKCYFRDRSTFEICQEEFEFVKEYQSEWKNTPHPVTFNTTDAVVTQSGYILMVTRKYNPGRGLLALPGGFLKKDLTLYDNALLELKEETRIRVDKKGLDAAFVRQHVFDDVYRSLRGRTITNAFHFQLPEHYDLPKVKGHDDASNAAWYLMSDLDPRTIYEDHHFIRSFFTGYNKR